MYRNYYSVNDMPQKVEKRENEKESIKTNEKNTYIKQDNNNQSGIFSKLENDDVILIAIIIILLLDDCDDKLLIIVLGILFFSGLADGK